VIRCRPTWFALALALCFVSTGRAGEAATPGGTVLSNSAEAAYTDESGHAFATISNTVTVTVAAVGSLLVTPKENGCNPQSDGFSLGAPLVRSFTITNTSNISDAYTIQAAAASAGTLTGIAFIGPAGPIPVTLGSTVSPTIAPGGTIQVQFTVSTSGMAPGTDVELSVQARTTVQGTANGLQSDTGEQCAIAIAGAQFGGPGGAASAILKLVDNVALIQSAPSAVVHYSIAFENYGGTPAIQAVLSDPLPAGVSADPTSVELNGTALPKGSVTLSGQNLSAALGTIATGSVQTLTFNATVANNASPSATLINVATLTAQNAAAAHSTPAVVILGSADIVFDGTSGTGAPVSGATLTLTAPASHQPILPSVITGSDGTYFFTFAKGTLAQPVTYDLTIAAPGFLNRRIQLQLTPDPTGTVFALDESALDAQYLALPGGFTLAPGPVHYPALQGFFGNLPLFPQHSISVNKSADVAAASLGDRVVFTIDFANTSPDALGATTVVDTLPPGLAYVPGTARLDGLAVEPARSGRQLTWSLSALNKAHVLVYATVVAPGTSPGASVTNVVKVSALAQNDPQPLTAQADASVQIIGGALDGRVTITGRVYLDRAQIGRFAKGDWGISGVRIYLEDGESVVTDEAGRYTFPSARPAMHVLRLDETSLPKNVRAYPVRAYNDERSTERLVHGVFDAYTLQDINFAVRPAQ
jgi:uncharacterized repeat protein (TIGR01451 family)